MSRARELQAAGGAKARNHVAGCTCPEHRVGVEGRETFVRLTKKHVTVRLTVPQAQALVEAGEEWPGFADMSGTQKNATKKGAAELRSALLGAGKAPSWATK